MKTFDKKCLLLDVSPTSKHKFSQYKNPKLNIISLL